LVVKDEHGKYWMLISEDIASRAHPENLPTLIHDGAESYYREIENLTSRYAHSQAEQIESLYISERARFIYRHTPGERTEQIRALLAGIS